LIVLLVTRWIRRRRRRRRRNPKRNETFIGEATTDRTQKHLRKSESPIGTTQFTNFVVVVNYYY